MTERVDWTERETRRLNFGRWLWLTGRVTEACDYRGQTWVLPPREPPSFPIGQLPERSVPPEPDEC